MVVGLMQPYFLPYLGHFQLIAHVDVWVVFDTVQYIRRGWMNRNRILHPSTGWQYLCVPIAKHARSTPIQEIRIANDPNWQEKIVRQLDHYRRHAPYFAETRELVQDCLRVKEDALARFNVHGLERTCDALGLRFPYVYLSALGLDLSGIELPGDWALRICAELGATEYVNPPGGRELYDPQRFAEQGIRLTIQSPHLPDYGCGPYPYLPGLSIVDVLMWNGAAEIGRNMLRFTEDPASVSGTPLPAPPLWTNTSDATILDRSLPSSG